MTILDHDRRAMGEPEAMLKCTHGLTFDHEAAAELTAREVRKRWPRLEGLCPLGCGYCGTAYVSYAHLRCGDW